jgi:hypothetical protein
MGIFGWFRKKQNKCADSVTKDNIGVTKKG